MEGIVCKVLDYKDSSKILYVYTNKGNQSILAHGVKKLNNKNRYLSQVPNIISFQEVKGNLPSLKDGELLEEFPHIEIDLEAYTFVSHILELVIHTIDDQNDHPKMFDFLRRLLRLYQEDYDPELLSFIFELKLLYFLGYGLRFTGCSLCQENNHLVYHIGSGGLVCKSHLDAFTDSYEEDVYTLIKDLYYTDINDLKFPQIDKNKRIIIRHILDVTYADFVSYQSKSRQILKQIKKY